MGHGNSQVITSRWRCYAVRNDSAHPYPVGRNVRGNILLPLFRARVFRWPRGRRLAAIGNRRRQRPSSVACSVAGL